MFAQKKQKCGTVSLRTLPLLGSTASNNKVSCTIHVVDDDLRLLRLVGLMLSVEGFQVRTFASGWDFLAGFAEELRPDAVVLDLMMPELDGIEVLKRARE